MIHSDSGVVGGLCPYLCRCRWPRIVLVLAPVLVLVVVLILQLIQQLIPLHQCHLMRWESSFLVLLCLLLLLLFTVIFLGTQHPLDELSRELGEILSGTAGVVLLVLGHGLAHAPDVIVQIGLTQEFVHRAYHHATAGFLDRFVRQHGCQERRRAVDDDPPQPLQRGKDHCYFHTSPYASSACAVGVLL